MDGGVGLHGIGKGLEAPRGRPRSGAGVVQRW